MSIDNDEKAFPSGAPGYGLKRGMTLRDYFAGQALIAVLSGGYVVTINNLAIENGISTNDVATRVSYEFADAMLKERAK